ncbi:hypothetical protein V3851_23615 [Paenibacillus sp. M1]|uniref:Uncharacterized protein n=1 Tax=Paenibacillus haidiansis TaxID=1574488 RepID=A0ABU7VZK2_9BACL|nr:hypothetical protein [Paenibacillus oralis]
MLKKIIDNQLPTTLELDIQDIGIQLGLDLDRLLAFVFEKRHKKK